MRLKILWTLRQGLTFSPTFPGRQKWILSHQVGLNYFHTSGGTGRHSWIFRPTTRVVCALEGTCNFTRSSARSLASLFSAMSVFGVLRWSRKFWDHLDGANSFPSVFRKARAVPRLSCGSGNSKSPLWAFQASKGIFWVLWENSVNFSIGSSWLRASTLWYSASTCNSMPL